MNGVVRTALALMLGTALLTGCSSSPDYRQQCLDMVEGVLAKMKADYPKGPEGEVITEVAVVTEQPLECRGRLFYDNSQAATIDFGTDYYRTSEGSTN
jgi:hypothetical protein